ncbi:MAG: helix-turn-helix transcriptional regulator [Oscillospiraceae bacterium]
MFYDVFNSLCKRDGKKPSIVAAELGINKSNVSNWKNNGYTPRGDALQQIADHFNVSTDYLLGVEKAPTQKDERGMTDSDLKFALFDGDKGITDAQFEEVKRFAQYVRERDKSDKK